MDYEKLYKEALEKAKIFKKHLLEINDNGYAEEIDYIFPELKESEDERIRKWIIRTLKSLNNSSIQIDGAYEMILPAIAWLEKQGEQKPTDKVEPKFKNGQWIVWQNKCYKVNYNGCGYELIDQNGLSISLEYVTVDENAHLWTIQDAKDGDVLSSEDKDKVFLYNGKFDLRGRVCAYCGIYKTYDGLRFTKCAVGNYFTYKEPYPATKEQRDLLFQKMKEAGYEWNVNKKEIHKLYGRT